MFVGASGVATQLATCNTTRKSEWVASFDILLEVTTLGKQISVARVVRGPSTTVPASS